MSLTILSFIAGILTVLAPCVLPLLPVIIGGGGTGGSKWRPYVITASLAISLALFTLLLKVSTLFIDIDPVFWTTVSGIIIIFLGLISVFPTIWDKISFKLNLSSNSDRILSKYSGRQDLLGAVLTGAALGPVFSSCSPTYAFILVTTLKGSLKEGLINMGVYILGLSLIMLVITLLGRSAIKRLKWASNPNGIFKKVLGVIFIIVGILILTGLDKKFQVFVEQNSSFSITNVDQKLLNNITNKGETYNPELIEPSKAIQAPELVGIQDWINSNPLTIQGLKGKVVLVDYWTYSCINCQRTQPYLNDWYGKYKDKGFEIIGVHAPEFAFEKKKENIEKAIQSAKIQYPVAMDNDFKTWDAYKTNAWPTKYLIDENGKIRYVHAGEGEYEVTEKNIISLLEEKGTKIDSKNIMSENKSNNGGSTSQITPETYLGWSRAQFFANQTETKYNMTGNYASKSIEKNYWTLNKDWIINNENIVSDNDESTLELNFDAKDVFIVAGSENKKDISVEIDGHKVSSDLAGGEVDENSKITVQEDKLYRIVESKNGQVNKKLKLTVPKGVRLNVFTFG